MTPASWWFALSVVVLACGCHSPQPTAIEPARKKRVLVYTVSAGYEHEVAKRASPSEPSIVERALVDLGRATGRFEAVLTRDASDFTPENLAQYDLVFFYTTGELPFTEAQRQALFHFVRDGKAFAGAHCAADTFYAAPEYGEMIGAYFDQHPWTELVRVVVEDPAHPACAHLGSSFEIDDEIYQFKAPYERSKLHVLLSLDADRVDLAREAVHRTDRDFAIAWTKEHGRGRVFYTALGHRPEVWRDPRFMAHLDGGLCWAMSIAPSRVAPVSSAERSDRPSDAGIDPARDARIDDGLALDALGSQPDAWSAKSWKVFLRPTWRP